MKSQGKITWSKCCGHRPKVQRDDEPRVWRAQCLMCFLEAAAETSTALVGVWNAAVAKAEKEKKAKQ